MIELPARKTEVGINVLRFQTRKVLQDLISGDTVGQNTQDVGHPDTHSVDARSTTALFLWCIARHPYAPPPARLRAGADCRKP